MIRPAWLDTLPRWSLALRLTVWYSAMALVLVVGVAIVQYRTLGADLASEDDQLVLETLATARRGTMPEPARDAPSAEIGPFVRLLDARCRTVAGIDPSSGPPPRCDPATQLTPILRTWRAPTHHTWRVATARLASDARAPGAQWIEVTLDRWTDEEVLRRFRQRFAIVLPATVLIAGLLGYGLARRGLAPITALADRVSRIDARSLDQQLADEHAPPEVERLTAAFGDMLARLRVAFGALTEFSAELAHEFRTPLHALRQQIEVTLAHTRTAPEYRDQLASTLEEVDRLARMVEAMLFLARAEDPRARIHATPLLVQRELADVAEFMDATAAERTVALVVEAPPDLCVVADRMLLRRAVVNLLTNAVHHSPAGGRVTLRADADDAGVGIDVHDEGQGIPAEAIPHVFDRYFRVATADDDGAHRRAEGAGLGLAIVRGIMRLHGGTATASSTSGRGTYVRLWFPSPSATTPRLD